MRVTGTPVVRSNAVLLRWARGDAFHISKGDSMLNLAIRSGRGVHSARSRGVLAAFLICLALPVVITGDAHAQGAPINISFQPASFPLQSGYQGDSGLVFGARGNGYSYGWNVDHT